MKHKCLIFFVLVASVLFIDACKTTKNIITSLPCESEAIDDSLYIKELGHGINNNLQFARKWALLDAQAKIITRFCDSIRTFMPLVVYQNDSLSVGFSDTVLFKYSMKYFGELSYTRKECEKVTFDLNNQYHSFIVLSLPKADIDNATLKVFSDFLNYMVDLSYQNPHDSIVVEETDEEELTK